MTLAFQCVAAVTFAYYIVSGWVSAIATATAAAVTNKSTAVSAEENRKINNLTGRLTLIAIGRTLWFGALMIMLWVTV